MGRSNRKQREPRHAPFIVTGLFIGLLASWLLGACTPTATPAPEVTPRPPTVQFLQGPPTLCRDATQLRQDVQVAGPEIRDASASWSLTRRDGDAPLNQGTWSGQSGELYVPFPDGTPLAPGDYEVRVAWQDETLAVQPFTIQAEAPSLEAVAVALIPDGAPQAPLAPETRHFYVQLTYADACPGAPYWLTVTHNDEVVCTRNGGLDAQAGTAAVPCYRSGGVAFAPGPYEATVTLMDDVHRTAAFDVAPPAPTPRPTPKPTATPDPGSPVCGPLFTAAGLTPAGEPYLPLTLFDWYTQAIYAGTACDALTPGTAWESAWYRNGEPVRTERGTWTGEPEGVIWDSLIGVPGSPFLRYGTYTITLQVGATAPLTAEVRVLAYPSGE